MEAALFIFALFAGMAVVIHGFNFGFIAVHKHYYEKEDEE